MSMTENDAGRFFCQSHQLLISVGTNKKKYIENLLARISCTQMNRVQAIEPHGLDANYCFIFRCGGCFLILGVE